MTHHRLPSSAQAMDVFPSAVWALTCDKNRAAAAAPFADAQWKAIGNECWVAGYVRRDFVVDYIELANPIVAVPHVGAPDSWVTVSDLSKKAAALLARHQADARAVWPLAVSMPLADLSDGTSVSAAFHCHSSTSLCVAVLVRAIAPHALARYVDRLSTILHVQNFTSCAFVDAVQLVRSDAELRVLVQLHTDSSLAKSAVSTRVVFLDAPLVDHGGVLTRLSVADLVRVLALLAVFKDDALSFTARILVRGSNANQVGVVLSQLLALTQPLLPFAGSVGLLVSESDIALAFGLAWPGLFGIESKLFDTIRPVARRHANSDAEVDALLGDLVVVDLDQGTLAVPPRFVPLTLLPNSDDLVNRISAVLRGENGGPVVGALTQSRTVQLLVSAHVQDVLDNVMLVGKYVDLTAGAFASDKFCADQLNGLLQRRAARTPILRALAYSPLVCDHYVMREVIVPYLAQLMHDGDSASFRSLGWLHLSDQAKGVTYATRLKADRVTLLHLAYEHFLAGNANEYARTASFSDVLVNWANDVTRANPMKQLDVQCRMPLYYLCRARPEKQLREHADKLKMLLQDPAPAGTKLKDVDNPVKLLSTPFFVLYRAWDNVTMLMSGVKNQTPDIALVLIEALDRVPPEFALELVSATTYSGGMSALHDACAGGGNAPAVKAILEAVRRWRQKCKLDADEHVLTMLGAVREIDGRTPLHTASRLKSGDVLREMLAQLAVVRASSAAHAKRVLELLAKRSSADARGLNNVTALEDAEACKNDALAALTAFIESN